MTKTEKSMCFIEFLQYMDDDDPGAELVISQMLAANEPSKTTNTLNKLDEKGVRGAKLYEFYYRVCNRSVETLFAKVKQL